MLRRHFLLQAAGSLDASAQRPNIVLVVAESWRAQALGKEGDRDLVAPSLARLANESLYFGRAYTANPSSEPSRAALLRGKFPHAFGAASDSEASLLTVLAGGGYDTASESRLEAALSFLRKPARAPFCLYFLLKREGAAGRYDGRVLSLRDNVPRTAEVDARNSSVTYYGECTAMDARLGELLRALDELGLAAGTVVVFTSDHGAMLGSQGLDGAGVPYEESVRIPLLVRYPGRMEAGVRSELPVSNVDLAPTLLRLAGLPVPAGMQGRDLSVLWTGGSGERPESLFAEGRIGEPGEWRMIVRGLDKMAIDSRNEVTHLFNLGIDPFEMSNQASSRAARQAEGRVDGPDSGMAKADGGWAQRIGIEETQMRMEESWIRP